RGRGRDGQERRRPPGHDKGDLEALYRFQRQPTGRHDGRRPAPQGPRGLLHRQLGEDRSDRFTPTRRPRGGLNSNAKEGLHPMADAYIFDAVRTPRGKGKKDGALHEMTALSLATQVLENLRDRNALDTSKVDDVVMGCVSPV